MVAHPVRLAAPRPDLDDRRPLLLAREEPDFVPLMLAELAAPNALRDLATRAVAELDDAASRRAGEAVARLRQPIHRLFHAVVVEAHCAVFGRPRLDPGKIESAGFVIRRRRADGGSDAWVEAPDGSRAWRKLDELTAELDPEPARRAGPRHLGGAPAAAALAAEQRRRWAVTERTTPLFVVPPAAQRATGRTVLLGVVPTTSGETAAEPARPVRFAADERADFVAHLHPLLRRNAPAPPWLGREVERAQLVAQDRSDLAGLVTAIEQLAVEFGAFGDEPEGRALKAVLDGFTLVVGDETEPAGDVLASIAQAALTGERGGVHLPETWLDLDEIGEERLVDAMLAVTEARLATIVAGAGRFEDAAAIYTLRAFVRVDEGDGCPPRLIWSEPSRPFTIAPWFDFGDRPPTRIALPDASDRAALRRLKPNVAFAVPEEVMRVLRAAKLDQLVDGTAAKGSGLRFDWICGFNIPIITLCAFIVLSIFLALLNILFFWLPFVRICLPLPRKS